MSAYEKFAQVYDLFMDNIDYEGWAEYVTDRLREYEITDGLVLELGCGTGTMTGLLAGKGYDMIGVDNSEEMLAEAMEKRVESGQDILYLLQDMQEFARHMMIVTHDVTERLRIDEMRRDFVANVSHELRTPLTVISGFLDIESQGKVPANVMQKHRELMLDQARRMQSLLDDLLLLSGLENRDETDSDDAEVISMTKLLEDVVNEGRALSLGRHVITLEACRASLVGEPSDIRSAAMNLVSNAVRYTPEGGRIDVRWFRTSSGAVLSVKDTGIGIEEKHIPRLTERFYRVDKVKSPVSKRKIG